MKRRQNKVPLNFIAPLNRKRCRIVKQVIIVNNRPDSYQHSNTSNNYDVDNGQAQFDSMSEVDGTDAAQELSSHTIRKERLSQKWAELRSRIYITMVNKQAISDEAECYVCGSPAVIRCLQCGPFSMCSSCCTTLHSSKQNFHHFPEIWKNGCFVPFNLPTPSVSLDDHVCDSSSMRLVTCFHTEGIPQNLNIQFCKCKPDALTLVELGYWPGTPSRPLVAFSFSFMDWMEALLLECQVSVQDFTNAVEIYLQENIVQMPCSIYPVLIDTFEEYRHAKGKLRMLHEICDDSTKPCFNSCPACPKDNGMLTLSIDANFGLCRKKSAGSSVHPPLSGSSMFLNQEEVDEYVCQYATHPTRSTEGCSEFLAGSALRSQNRYSALKETAVMGVVCRHEFPKCFLNLHHGERISYCVYLLEKLKDLYPNHSIQLMYDISCLLVKHLVANKRTDLLEGFEFAIPVFHAYGHTSQCQILRNPRNITGFGLSDGEVVERLWSFLRRFSAMTKEMRPSHRVDVLTDALLYYCRKIAKKIGQLLCKRMRHAKDVLNNATASLDILKQSSSEPLSEDDIECWSSEMMQNISRNSLPHEISQSWQEEYVSLLDKISSVMNALESSGFDNHVLGISYMLIIDQKIQEIEQKHGIQTRWLDDCPEYIATKSVIQSKEKQKLKLKMRDQAKERWYLLKLKAKYADGQKIAIRLSRRINLVSKQLKGTIAKYNANQPQSTQVQWKDATDLSNDIYKEAVFASSNIPHSFKAQAVELRHKIFRCNEEITRLEEEMKCCSQHFIAKYMGLCQLVDTLESAEVQGRYTKGSISLLKKCLHRCRFELKSLSCLMEYTKLPELEAMLTEFCRDNEVFNSDVDINDDDVENICLRNPEQDALSSSDESMLATDDEGENEQYTQWNVQENQALNNSNATEPGDDVLGGSQLQSTGSQLQSTGSQLQSTGSQGKASPLSMPSGSQLQSTGSQLQSTGSQLQSTGSHSKASPLSMPSGSRLQSTGSQLQSTGSQLQSTGSQLQSTGSHGKASTLSMPSGSQLQSTGSQLQSTSSQLQSTGSQLQSTGSQLQSTGSHGKASPLSMPTPCSPNNSSDSEEEMEVQHWRVQSYLQEEYLKTIRSKTNEDLLAGFEEDMKILQKVTQASPASLSCKPKSFLTYPPHVLQQLLKDARESTANVPFFRKKR